MPGNVTYPKPGKPTTLPGNINRPGKPTTLPGNINRPGKPTTLPGNINRPDKPTTLPGNINRPVTRPGQNTRPVQRPDFNRPTTLPANRPNRPGNNNNNWWNSGRPGNGNNNGNHWGNNNGNHWGNNNINNGNININNNFQNNINWSTHHKNWGYNPWWNRPATRPWYGGSWNCGWNNNYYHHHNYYHGAYYGGYRPWPGYVVYEDHHNDAAQAIGWGLIGWSLGKLIYDTGYQTYRNPYPAQPVPSATGGQVTYAQPITVVAAETAPADQDASMMTAQSESFITDSQAAFKQGDYLKALESANKAVGAAPGDGALHEYRALVLFALGKYAEAAGVLNPVLAGGPGWDWTTMISLYPAQETYLAQLDSLEKYSKAKPQAADAHFLLGYHLMVFGQLAQAAAEFTAAAKLQPADSVSAQLRDLTLASSNNGDEDPSDDAQAPDTAAPPPPTPVPLEQLTGTWVADKGAQGSVTLAFKDDGKFSWTYQNGDKANEFGGDFSMNDNGLLVLDAEQSQMVAAIDLPKDNELKFVLAGGPPGDPGLQFAKK